MNSSILHRSHLADDIVLTTREAAAYLGVSVTTAQLWMETGKIWSWKTPGGHRRCHRSEVERVLMGGPSEATGTLIVTEEFIQNRVPCYPVLKGEQERLLALARSGLVDSPPDPAFDRLTWLAAEITGCPIALVSLLTSTRQWFKSKIGLEVCETPRSDAFCTHAILTETGLVVENAQIDPRFANNPLVTGQPHIRFYAGVPITDQNKNRLGTLCVIDLVPRKLTANEWRGLQELAGVVSNEVGRT